MPENEQGENGLIKISSQLIQKRKVLPFFEETVCKKLNENVYYY